MPVSRCYYCALYTWLQRGDGTWACGYCSLYSAPDQYLLRVREA